MIMAMRGRKFVLWILIGFLFQLYIIYSTVQNRIENLIIEYRKTILNNKEVWLNIWIINYILLTIDIRSTPLTNRMVVTVLQEWPSARFLPWRYREDPDALSNIPSFFDGGKKRWNGDYWHWVRGCISAHPMLSWK